MSADDLAVGQGLLELGDAFGGDVGSTDVKLLKLLQSFENQ